MNQHWKFHVENIALWILRGAGAELGKRVRRGAFGYSGRIECRFLRFIKIVWSSLIQHCCRMTRVRQRRTECLLSGEKRYIIAMPLTGCLRCFTDSKKVYFGVRRYIINLWIFRHFAESRKIASSDSLDDDVVAESALREECFDTCSAYIPLEPKCKQIYLFGSALAIFWFNKHEVEASIAGKNSWEVFGGYWKIKRCGKRKKMLAHKKNVVTMDYDCTSMQDSLENISFISAVSSNWIMSRP